MNLENLQDRVNREALWQVLRMHDVGIKLFSRIKCMYVDGLASVRVKGGESKCFRIEICAKHGFIMSPWFFNPYMDEVMEVKTGKGRRGKSGDFQAFCMQITWSEEDLRSMVGSLVELHRRKGQSNYR